MNQIGGLGRTSPFSARRIKGWSEESGLFIAAVKSFHAAMLKPGSPYLP
jgi:hypothetical protein